MATVAAEAEAEAEAARRRRSHRRWPSRAHAHSFCRLRQRRSSAWLVYSRREEEGIADQSGGSTCARSAARPPGDVFGDVNGDWELGRRHTRGTAGRGKTAESRGVAARAAASLQSSRSKPRSQRRTSSPLYAHASASVASVASEAVALEAVASEAVALEAVALERLAAGGAAGARAEGDGGGSSRQRAARCRAGMRGKAPSSSSMACTVATATRPCGEVATVEATAPSRRRSSSIAIVSFASGPTVAGLPNAPLLLLLKPSARVMLLPLPMLSAFDWPPPLLAAWLAPWLAPWEASAKPNAVRRLLALSTGVTAGDGVVDDEAAAVVMIGVGVTRFLGLLEVGGAAESCGKASAAAKAGAAPDEDGSIGGAVGTVGGRGAELVVTRVGATRFLGFAFVGAAESGGNVSARMAQATSTGIAGFGAAGAPGAAGAARTAGGTRADGAVGVAGTLVGGRLASAVLLRE